MSCVVQFIGGPADGTEVTIPEDRPPLDQRVAHVPEISAGMLADSDDAAPQFLQSLYRLQLGPMGLPSRADDGSFRYRYAGRR